MRGVSSDLLCTGRQSDSPLQIVLVRLWSLFFLCSVLDPSFCQLQTRTACRGNVCLFLVQLRGSPTPTEPLCGPPRVLLAPARGVRPRSPWALRAILQLSISAPPRCQRCECRRRAAGARGTRRASARWNANAFLQTLSRARRPAPPHCGQLPAPDAQRRRRALRPSPAVCPPTAKHTPCGPRARRPCCALRRVSRAHTRRDPDGPSGHPGAPAVSELCCSPPIAPPGGPAGAAALPDQTTGRCPDVWWSCWEKIVSFCRCCADHTDP